MTAMTAAERTDFDANLRRHFKRAERRREIIKWVITVPVVAAVGAGIGALLPGLGPFTKDLTADDALSFQMAVGALFGTYFAALGCASTRGI
ncbi:hypothetical protein [Leifsonia aquatica]|uniref:Uncharacterized protein n=2 Tax=Leifsonia aquatica TaxID=144185 RepID=U2S5D4_LEIAQ|nr:hypothetical protein [Leifsonia aquatica]ERK60898.1 hypothetical protein N136_04898 [Leifsonia aquatica ATCC 14665]MBB2967927.1 hypothetical protein [Leifsonia aquatica]